MNTKNKMSESLNIGLIFLIIVPFAIVSLLALILVIKNILLISSTKNIDNINKGINHFNNPLIN